MVTVVKTPQGHKIIDQAIPATIIDSGGAAVEMPSHSLSNGDYVYITSDIEDYNGFVAVNVIDVDSFNISEYYGGTLIPFYQEAEIEYYQTQEHVWNAIFLPIVYKLNTTKWPNNSVSTIRSVTSFASDNGYTQLSLSGDLSVSRLLYVKIEGSDVDGVYQVIENGPLVINLPYDATNDLVGASVQFAYSSYQIKVKIFAGLSTHPYDEYKPKVEVAELSLTPDSNNEVMLSVSDYIKGKVNIRNNTLLFSLPLNLDFFTGFHIMTAESYDTSDGYSIGTFKSTYVQDSFEGYAVAGKLPFKNVYSGDYADYIQTSGSPAKWLTLASRLLAVDGKFFDVSFIKAIEGSFELTIKKYVADYLMATEVQTFEDKGVGVYRIPVEADANYNSFCIQAATNPVTPVVVVLQQLEDWEDGIGPYPGNWTYTSPSDPHTSINGDGGEEGFTWSQTAFEGGTDYLFSVVIQIDETFNPLTDIILTWAICDAAGNELDSVSFNYTTQGFHFEKFNLTPSGDGLYFGLRITNNTPSFTRTVTIRYAVAENAEQLLINRFFTFPGTWIGDGTGTPWVITGGAATLALPSGDSELFYQDFTGTGAGNYMFMVDRTTSGFDIGTDGANFPINAYDSDGNVINGSVEFMSGNQRSVYTFRFVSPVPVARFGFRVQLTSGADINVAVTEVALYGVFETPPPTEAELLTEEICIDIIEDCEVQDGFTPSEIRLIEDGGYRLLE